jgi:hypothetical protein
MLFCDLFVLWISLGVGIGSKVAANPEWGFFSFPE